MADIPAGNVVIGIAQMGYVKMPATITTYALGSCVGVVLYDRVTKCAGMVHVLLPTYDVARAVPGQTVNRAKYANLGVQELYQLMLKNGSRKPNLAAKMAGGAHMFGDPKKINDMLNVGQRNITECKRALVQLGIQLESEDTAGQYGRTITMDTSSGMLHVKTVGRGEREI